MNAVMFRLLVCVPFFSTLFAQTPVFLPPASSPGQKASLAITTADLNGDGILDLAIANGAPSTLSIFLGTGNGKFSSSPSILTLPSDCQPAYLATASFTGGKSPDLLAVCPVGPLYVIPNQGGAVFGAPIGTTLPLPAWVGNLMLGSIHPAIADFNGDGHLDIAVPSFGSDVLSATGGWYLLLGRGDGSFQNAKSLPFNGFLPTSIASGDFNGDGKLDLVAALADNNGNAVLQFAAGDGAGGFKLATKSTALPLTAGTLVLPADIDGDGKLDLVLAGGSLFTNLKNALDSTPGSGASAVTVLLGDGAGNFKQNFNATEPSYMSGAVLTSIFGNGKLDLVQTMINAVIGSSALPTGAIEVRPGNGDGTFGNPIVLSSFPSSTVPTDLVLQDFNGDGRPDIAISSVPAAPMPGFSLNGSLGNILASILSQFPQGSAEVLLNQTAGPTTPQLTSGTLANGATFIEGGLVPGSWAQVKGSNLAVVKNYLWQSSDFAGLGSALPTNLKGTAVTVNGTPAAVYYADSSQINFQVPAGISGTASVQVSVNSILSNTIEATASPDSPGIFPVALNGVNYAGGVFTDGTIVGDPSVSAAFRHAKPGDVIQLFATGLAPSTAGVLITAPAPLTGVTITIGSVTFPADYAALVGVGLFQINFTVPQQFASMQAGNYEVTISANGVSSPPAINSAPPGPVVIPIEH